LDLGVQSLRRFSTMSKDFHGLDPPADVDALHIAEIQNLDSPPTPSLEDDKEFAAIEARYSPSEEASQLPPGAGGEGDDAFAAQPSIFDDPDLRKFYWPRHNYENIHRFFPDFKWTVGEERRYQSSSIVLVLCWGLML
jgi:hypothetical protein